MTSQSDRATTNRPAAPHSARFSLLTTGGDHKFPGTPFRINYRTANEGSAPVVWTSSGDTTFAFTLLNSPSGSGKTTFISNVYHYLQGKAVNLRFDFQPDLVAPERYSFGYIPQHSPMANHWRVSDLVPPDSCFLAPFFPGDKSQETYAKRLGQLSGGQKLKVYVCSALERLHRDDKDAAFLVLDEVFDGLGAEEARRSIGAVRNKWVEVSRKPLYVLLVSHLDVASVIPKDVRATRISLAVLEENESELIVAVENRV